MPSTYSQVGLEVELLSSLVFSRKTNGVESCFLYLCQWSLTDCSGCYREPDIRMIIEMALRVACTDRLRQLKTNSESLVRSNGQAESQHMEESFEASEFWIASF